MKNKEQIQAALAILIKEGAKSFVASYEPSDAECIAMAISAVNDDPTFTMEIAASHAEDWNWHESAKQIREISNS